jgi:hypothetical protein
LCALIFSSMPILFPTSLVFFDLIIWPDVWWAYIIVKIIILHLPSEYFPQHTVLDIVLLCLLVAFVWKQVLHPCTC